MSEVSLMFAVEAEQLLMAGLAEDAIELCNVGLEEYPGYAAAFSVLARAYSALGDRQQAEMIIDISRDDVPATSYLNIKESLKNFEITDMPAGLNISEYKFQSQSTSDLTINETSIEDYPEEKDEEIIISDEEKIISDVEVDIDESDSHENSSLVITSVFDNEPEFEIQPESNLIEEIEYINDTENADKTEYQKDKLISANDDIILKASNISLIPGLGRFTEKPQTILFSSKQPVRKEKVIKIFRKQNDFLSIISSLNKAQPIKPEFVKRSESNIPSVVITDTIAGILEQQGALREAKNAYLELADRNPAKKKFYKQKISEIEEKLK